MEFQEQIRKLCKLTEFQIKMIESSRKEKEKLISILIQKNDSKTQLRNIRQFLLESQISPQQIPSAKETISESCSSFEKTCEKESIGDLFDKVSCLNLQQLEDMTSDMKKMFEPALTMKKLKDDISVIIRSSTLTDEEKIDKISDLLI
jgi:hypothetical protein